MATRDADRRAVVEQMRREQQRKERRSTLLTIGAAVMIGAIIIGVAVWQLLKESSSAATGPLASIGVPMDEAGCQELITKKATGSAVHEPTGKKILYPDAPPADGPHWGNALAPQEVRRFYTADDRPELERLVHSLEHGWSILWYDSSIADDEAAVGELEGIAEEFPDVTDRDQKIIIAPWTSEDQNGTAFPDGAHLALTHWSRGEGEKTSDQVGVWQYCDKVSGEVVQQFMTDYPASDSPEGIDPRVF